MTVKMRFGFRALLLVFGLAALTAAAHADVKIVSKITITGGDANAPSVPILVTTLYQGADARVESPGGTLIYDGEAGKVYHLDPFQKSFYEVSYKQAMSPQSGANASGRQAKFDASLDLTQTDPTDADMQTLSGQQARKYLVSGTVRPESSGGGRQGGGRRHRGGGGFPGGGFPGFQRGGGGYGGGDDGDGQGGYGGGYGRQRSITTVTGEIWLSDTVKLPDDKKATLFPTVSFLAWSGDALFKPLSDKLSKTGSIPLESKITLYHVQPGVNEDVSNTEPGTTTTMKVTALSLDPLDPSLFKVPSNYTQVNPPDAQ